MGKRAKEGRTSSWETFAWERRSSWRIELGFDALESLEEVACVQIWRLGAAFIHYFLESFHLWGGRTIWIDCFLLRESSSHQNWEISVAEHSQQQDSHSCGGDSLSDFSVAFQSRSGSWERGAPHLGLRSTLEPDSFIIWSCYCTRFFVVLYLLL